jgi:hypothetical protein
MFPFLHTLNQLFYGCLVALALMFLTEWAERHDTRNWAFSGICFLCTVLAILYITASLWVQAVLFLLA